MAIVTGTMTDFNLQAFTGLSPRLIFTPSGASTLSGRLLVAKPIVVSPNSAGEFSVDLRPTTLVMPAIHYNLRVEWLDSDGGYVGADVIDWELEVPEDGGAIGDLASTPTNPALAWVGVKPPPFQPTPGSWWLQINPDNPNDPNATGVLYEWG